MQNLEENVRTKNLSVSGIGTVLYSNHMVTYLTYYQLCYILQDTQTGYNLWAHKILRCLVRAWNPTACHTHNILWYLRMAIKNPVMLKVKDRSTGHCSGCELLLQLQKVSKHPAINNCGEFLDFSRVKCVCTVSTVHANPFTLDPRINAINGWNCFLGLWFEILKLVHYIVV